MPLCVTVIPGRNIHICIYNGTEVNQVIVSVIVGGGGGPNI